MLFFCLLKFFLIDKHSKLTTINEQIYIPVDLSITSMAEVDILPTIIRTVLVVLLLPVIKIMISGGTYFTIPERIILGLISLIIIIGLVFFEIKKFKSVVSM